MRQRLTGGISALRSKKLLSNGARTGRRARATVEGLEDRRLLSVVAGPDGGGYYAESGPLLPIDLTEGGPNVQVITGLTGQDDFAAPINLGENSFKLYGVEYTGASLYVGTNGLITFGSGNVEYINDTLSARVPQAAVAPLWDDWLIRATESRVMYQFSGDRLIVEWNMVQNWNTGPSLVTFQAILELNTNGRAGDITFNYVDLDTGNPETANGASATVGIKGVGATTERLVVSFNAPPATPNQAKPAVATGSSIRVTTNRPPVLSPLDAAFVPEGRTVRLSASASDPDGDTLAYHWDLNDDGVFETPGREVDFSAAGLDGPGAQQIAVRVDDGRGHVVTAAGSVTITNAAPVANDDTATVAEDGDLRGNALANDSDAGNTGSGNSERLSAELVQGAARGRVSFGSDGSYNYWPDSNYFGSDSFTYRVSDKDGGVSRTATVNITVTPVNDAPVAAPDVGSVTEDARLSGNVLANDTDVDGDALTASLAALPADGIVDFASDGTFTYTPAANFHGRDEFSYRVNDGTVDGDIATIRITVTPVNDAPVAVDDSGVTDEDTTLTIAAADLLANDSDVDHDALSLEPVDGPSHGTLGQNDDGTFSYTPHANYHGADRFTYVVRDGNGGEAVASVTLTVRSVNDAPVAVNDATSTDEDRTVTDSVLGNDTDPDWPTNASGDGVEPEPLLVLTRDEFDPLVSPLVSPLVDEDFTDVEGVVGPDEPLIMPPPSDDLAGDNVLVQPEEVDGYGGTPSGGPGTTAAPGALTAVLVNGPSNGSLTLRPDGSYTYTPDADFFGTDSFTYRVEDAEGATSGTATVSVTVTPVNDAPVAAGEAYTVAEDGILAVAASGGVLANDSDVDRDTLSAVVVDGPSRGALTLNPDGSFLYTPAANYHGIDGFTYRAGDGALVSGDVTVRLVVDAVNDAPTATADHYATDEDQAIEIAAPGLLANDSDVDGDALTAALVSGPSHGTLARNDDGSFSYTPDANFYGTDRFTYRAEDAFRAGGEATVTIDVAAVNDAPDAGADGVVTREDVEVGGSVLANDHDVEDGRPVRAELVTGPTKGTLVLAADGTFTYTPNPNTYGFDHFTYKAFDATGAESAAAQVTITVDEVNDVPVAEADAATTGHEAPFSGNVLVNDSDADNDVLTAALVTAPSTGTVALEPDGRFVYTPAPGSAGTDTFRYRVSDGRGGTAEAVVTITVAQEPVPEPELGVQLVPDVTQPGKMALLVNGTAGSELVAVLHAAGGVEVYFGCESQGVFEVSGRIIVHGNGGNDLILVGPGVQNAAWLYGDAGNDVVKLGHAGGIAFGGAGNDAIVGGNGRDVLVGGEGADVLVGNSGDDILVSAATAFDDRANANHDATWAGIRAEWTSSRSFAERVNNLRDGTGPAGRLNGSYFLNDGTIQADTSADILSGSSGSDWFLYRFGQDLVAGMSASEAQYDVGIS